VTATPAQYVSAPSIRLVDLESYFDNRGITSETDLATGEFNIWFNSFPAEELPPPGNFIEVGAVPFLFPAPNAQGKDNFRCSGQLIELPPGDYDWIYLLAVAERRSEDFVYLHYADGATDPEWLRVSDFWAETPAHFGEQHYLRCTCLHYPRHVQRKMGSAIWSCPVPVPRLTPLAAIRLPDNPAIHIFALSLMTAARQGGAA
jgi:hypothetical protein